jgi:nitrogen fixation-related uncharacterized protein
MLSTILSLLGLAIAVGALLLLGHVSGLGTGGGGGDFQLLAVAIVAFLVGIFLFGWGLGKRTQY